MLNPVHLRTLVVAVRTGSFADAARQLGYTASAVSQQVSSLERALRLTLFERDARSIKATAAAEVLARNAQTVLTHLDILKESARELELGKTGRIRIGTFPTASQTVLPIVLSLFKRDLPAVEIVLDEGEPDELLALLVDRELDHILVYSFDLVPQSWPEELSPVTLLEEDLLLLMSKAHPLVNDKEITLSALSGEKWISTRDGTAAATFLRRVCAESGFNPNIDFRSDDYDVIRAFVQSGLGIALVPALSYTETDDVIAVRLKGLRAQRRITALRQAGRTSPLVSAVCMFLQVAATSLSERFDLVSLPELREWSES